MVLDPETVNLARNAAAEGTNVTMKEPKNILNFSDGNLEEYEDEVDSKNNEQAVVDPATLTWGPWFIYKAWAAGTNTLYYIDKTGEFFASAFGITTPKYYFEVEEFKRREEIMKKQQAESKGWSERSTTIPFCEIETKQPAESAGDHGPLDV